MNQRYFAACTLGLESVLRDELQALGMENVREARGGAHFTGNRRAGYRAALWLRSALRVQLELAERSVRDERALYDLVRDQAWERFLDADGTLLVDASVRDSFLTHTRFAAQLVKDAVVDRFRDRFGRRPNVARTAPDLPIKLRLNRDVATLYVDLSGESLHKRGYRDVQVKSPLNEAIAAGLLLATGWDRASPLADPMCGSGTFVIEAARLAGDVAPGLQREFAFERWNDLERRAWAAIRDDARERAAAGRGNIPPLEAADRHGGAISIAQRSVRAAGMADVVRFTTSDLRAFEPAVEPALVVCNPPYGERLGEGDDLERSWRALGDWLRGRSGATAWVLCGNPELTRFLGLRTSRRLPVRNGPIDCRFLRYEIR